MDHDGCEKTNEKKKRKYTIVDKYTKPVATVVPQRAPNQQSSLTYPSSDFSKNSFKNYPIGDGTNNYVNVTHEPKNELKLIPKLQFNDSSKLQQRAISPVQLQQQNVQIYNATGLTPTTLSPTMILVPCANNSYRLETMSSCITPKPV